MEQIGIITGIKPFAVHDGPGIRTTLFLKGCPLRCRWCHNPETQSSQPQLFFYAQKCLHCGQCAAVCSRHTVKDGKHIFLRDGCTACGKCAAVCPNETLVVSGEQITVNEAWRRLTADRAFYQLSNGGVTLSGGEPLMQADFCMELLKKLHDSGIHTALDTSGFAPWESLEKLLPFTQLVLYDIKAVTPELHKFCTGQDNHLILENLRRLCALEVPLEIRVPLFHGVNDAPEEMEKLGHLFSSLEGPSVTAVCLLRGHDMARSKYAALGMTDTTPHVAEEDNPLPQASDILRRFSLNVIA